MTHCFVRYISIGTPLLKLSLSTIRILIMSFNYGFWLMTCADSDLKDSPNSALSFCISLMWLATHCITSQASINSNKKVSCNREVARGKVYVLHSICQKIPFVNWFILYKQESLPYLNYRQLIEEGTWN